MITPVLSDDRSHGRGCKDLSLEKRAGTSKESKLQDEIQDETTCIQVDSKAKSKMGQIEERTRDLVSQVTCV